MNSALLEIHSAQSIVRGATAGGGTVTTPAFDSGMKTALLTVTLPNGKIFIAETTFFS
ncbi:MAG: hypothetical protein M3114_01280 [Thermoproteota archaeon]|nr:hypothetical protein [Thermoproteota archaeon]MDQ4066201.1 hypothetical protein [Thermoproteota archaeon]